MKNIIFDWSGVVRDAVTSQLWIVNKIFEKYRVDSISLEEFRENWEQPYFLFYKKYLPKDYTEEEGERLYREYVYNKNCPKPSVYTGMLELIKKLKHNGAFLAIVSSDLSDTLLTEIKEWNLENVFNVVVTEASDKLIAVQKIISDNNLNPNDSYFIGDSNHEIEVAKKTGIKSVAVTWGFTSEKKLRSKNPDFIANNTHELEVIILY